MSEENEELTKAQFFYNYVEKISSILADAQDRLYTKVKDIITIIMALIPVLFGLGYFLMENNLQHNFNNTTNSYNNILQRYIGSTNFKFLMIPISLSLIFLAISIYIGIKILWHYTSIYY